MDNLNYSPSDATNRKWACPACTYLNWPKALSCTQCEKSRENLNTIITTSPSLGSRLKGNTKDRLTSIFEGLKLSELQSTNEENNRIGYMKNSPTSPRREVQFYSPSYHAPASEVIENTSGSHGLSPPPESSPLICQSISPKQSAFNFNQTSGSDYGLVHSSSTYGAIGSNRSSNQTSSHWTTEEEGEEDSKEKWSCVLCTYDNWPRAIKCVMCLTPRGKTISVHHRVSSPDEGSDSNSYSRAQGNNRSALTNEFSLFSNNRITNTGNNVMSHAQNSILVPNNRRTRELDRRWLEACNAVVDGNINIVEAYLAAGGDPSRQLTQTEVAILDRPSAFEVGLTLIHLALRFQQENLLATLLSQVDGTPTVVKRVPSAAAPDLAVEVRRHVMSIIRQRKGHFRCHVISEIATFTLPSEIEDYPTDLQETVFDEVLDRDVQKELDNNQIINWSTEIMESLNSRLYALWNRSAGDCLLDSVLQATWGIFDQDNGLRQALSDSLQECATMFYQRWKDNELIHAHLLHFSLNDSQCAADWANLVYIASKPGSSLEQLHIFVLAHILRRPIIVYGVKLVKSFRGETLGFARYEGLYLPFFWEPAFCFKSPICLGYTRGHFSALVTIEPDCDPMSTSTSAAQLVPPDISEKCSYLPLTSVDGNLLPIHFLTQSELGKEEMIMNQWLDVRYTDTGLMIACQQIQTPPAVVGRMMAEWLNHYRRLGQVAGGGGSFLRPPVAPCYSSDESDD